MVSVTTKNFDEQFKFFAEKLSTCSFVAFDEEMTGIMLDPECTPKNSDTIEERYQKMKKVASTFNLMQVGFCFFHEQEDGSFLGTPFNFYVFPGENSGQTIQMDASTASFHRKNCMNFNDWIYFGVPFIKCSKFDEEVEKVNAAQEDDGSKDSKKRLSISNKKDKDFIAFVLKRLDSWIEEKRGGKAEALPQMDGADGDGAADGSMEVEGTADGAATAPPAEAEAQEAAAGAASDPAASAETMEVEGEAAVEPAMEPAMEPAAGSEAAEEPKAEASSGDAPATEAGPADPAAGEAPADGAEEAAPADGAEEAAPADGAEEAAPADEPAAKAEAPEPVFPEPRHEGDAFVIPECNSYLRKAFYQEIRAVHPDLFLNSASGNNRLKEIFVTLEPNADSKEKKLEELQKQSGFRQVYLLLSESKKPMVGHNCLFDLLFLYSHFEDELPDSLSEWKKELHSRFPTIYDTKVIGTALGYGDTSLPTLSQAAAAVSGAPTVAVDPAYSDYTTKVGLHEAGFDAWLTGSVFARLGGREILADADNKYKNRLHLSRSLQLLNLAGKDESVSGAIFHSSFPDSTNTRELVGFFGSPLQVSGVPARVTSEEFVAALAKFGEVEFSILSPNPDGKSSGSGFVAFKDAEHATAATAAIHDSKSFFEGGDGEEAALKCAPLRVTVQWIDDTSAYLILPTCTNEEGAALVAERSAKSSIKVVTHEEFKDGSHGAGKQAGGKRGRQSGSHAHDTPSKGGKKGKAAAKEEDAPKAEATSAKDRKSAAADAAEDGAAGGRGGRKRGRASTEEAAAEEAAPKKSARGGRQSKASAETAHEEKEEDKEEKEEEKKEEAPATAASPEKQPADKSAKRGGKAAAKSGGRAKRGGKAAAEEEANEEEEKEEKHEDEKEASPAKPAEASPPAKQAGGRAGKRGSKAATTEEKAEETAAAPSPAQPTGGRAARRGAAASKEEKEEEADKMEEDEEEEEEKPQKGGKGKGRKGKAAPKAEPAAAAATGKSPRGKAAAAAAESPAPAEDESMGRRRSGRR